MCDKITEIKSDAVYSKVFGGFDVRFNFDIYAACLTKEQIFDYLGEGKGYSWYISDLVIYDKPKELNEFRTLCKEQYKEKTKCRECGYFHSEGDESIGFFESCCFDGVIPLTRPPQSWCYVEEMESEPQ